MQLDTHVGETKTIYTAARAQVLDFGIHVEPAFYGSLKIHDITVSCLLASWLKQAYLTNPDGSVLLGVGKFRSIDIGGIPIMRARILHPRLTTIVADENFHNFNLAIRVSKFAPSGDIYCGISHINFTDPETNSLIEDGRVSNGEFDSFPVQRITIQAI